MSYSAAISISKDSYESTRSTYGDETFEIKTNGTSRSPMLFNGGADDEVIENDTPPPTPINGLLDHEPSSIPRKRTRFNSNSREFDRPPSLTRFRSPGVRQNDTSSFRSMEFDDSPRSSRTMGDTGSITEKYNSFAEYNYPGVGSSSSSSASTLIVEKDFSHDDLPDLEIPDKIETGRGNTGEGNTSFY